MDEPSSVSWAEPEATPGFRSPICQFACRDIRVRLILHMLLCVHVFTAHSRLIHDIHCSWMMSAHLAFDANREHRRIRNFHLRISHTIHLQLNDTEYRRCVFPSKATNHRFEPMDFNYKTIPIRNNKTPPVQESSPNSHTRHVVETLRPCTLISQFQRSVQTNYTSSIVELTLSIDVCVPLLPPYFGFVTCATILMEMGPRRERGDCMSECRPRNNHGIGCLYGAI
jgi:hypothetical protein